MKGLHLFIDKNNLKSLPDVCSYHTYSHILGLLNSQGIQVHFNFSEADVLNDPLLFDLFREMGQDVKDTPNPKYEDKPFPNRPCGSTPIEGIPQASLACLVDERSPAVPGVQLKGFGEELPFFDYFFLGTVKERIPLFTKTGRFEWVNPNAFKHLASFIGPFRDLVLHDRHLLSAPHRSMINRNVEDVSALVAELCKGEANPRQVVIVCLDPFHELIEPLVNAQGAYDSINTELRKALPAHSSLSLVFYKKKDIPLLEHNRSIISNYIHISPDIGLTEFSPRRKRKGSFHIKSLANSDNRNEVSEILSNIQKFLDSNPHNMVPSNLAGVRSNLLQIPIVSEA